MKTVVCDVEIVAERRVVFDTYVNHIDRWWPRRGTYRYSFAPAGREPRHIRFEPKLGGRFYETFDDGSQLVIGTITTWEPPDRLAYTWQDPAWPGPTRVQVTFVDHGGGTIVTVTHSGFGTLGVPAVGAGYRTGLLEILEALRAWTAAHFPIDGG